MKDKFSLRFIFTGLVLVSLLLCFDVVNAQCNNCDFSDGNFTGWTGTFSLDQCSGTFLLGICSGCSATNPYDSTGFNQGPLNDPVSDATNEWNQVIMSRSAGNDPNIATLTGSPSLPMVWPGGASLYSGRIGNMWQDLGSSGTGDGESISYSFLVTAGNCNFTYHYAAVLYDGGHSPGQQPYFSVGMTDGSGDTIPFAAYFVDATTAATIGGFNHDVSAEVYWSQWNTVTLPLSSYIGQTVKITFTTRGCIPSGCAGSHYAYAYISAESAPASGIYVAHALGCGDTSTTLTAPAGAASYSWTGARIIGPSNRQTITADSVGLYTVTMMDVDSLNDTITLDTLLTGNYNTLVANFTTSAYSCTPAAINFTDQSTSTGAITSWTWDLGNGTSSASQDPSTVYTTAGTYLVTLVVTSPPCTADTTIDITIAEAPTSTFTVTSPVCEGQNSIITYTGTGSAMDTFAWNFDSGTVASGTGIGPLQVYWPVGGTKIISLTVGSGSCTSAVGTEEIVIEPFGGTATFSVPTQICQATPVTVTYTGTGDNSDNFAWDFVGGQIVSGSGMGPFEVFWNTPGPTTIDLTVSNFDCSNSSVDTIDVVICQGIAEVEAGGISIFPNPAKNDFTITVNNAIQNGQLEIYDVLGQRVYANEINNQPAGFSRQIHLVVATGVYLVRLSDGEQVYTGNVVVE